MELAKFTAGETEAEKEEKWAFWCAYVYLGWWASLGSKCSTGCNTCANFNLSGMRAMKGREAVVGQWSAEKLGGQPGYVFTDVVCSNKMKPNWGLPRWAMSYTVIQYPMDKHNIEIGRLWWSLGVPDSQICMAFSWAFRLSLSSLSVRLMSISLGN